MEIAGLTGVFFLAVFLEGLLTYLFKKDGETTTKPWIKYIALAVGIGLAIGYKIDLPTMAGLTTNIIILNYIISGIIIGRGSNYLNDIVTYFQKGKNTGA